MKRSSVKGSLDERVSAVANCRSHHIHLPENLAPAEVHPGRKAGVPLDKSGRIVYYEAEDKPSQVTYHKGPSSGIEKEEGRREGGREERG